MRVLLFCAAPRGSRSGNRRTAERWAKLLRHDVHIVSDAHAKLDCDVLVALHARHGGEILRRARAERAGLPTVLALTGTDLSHDIAVDPYARGSLALADRLVVLHDLAVEEVPAEYRDIVRVIPQSARPPAVAVARARTRFEVAVVGHLRAVKDPLRAALAARRLPASSRVRVVHAGAALDEELERAAIREQRENPRYRWLGDVPPARALRLIAHARVFVLSSHSEGGANVLGEAIVCGTPVIASDIPAARSALGDDYPALFESGDEAALARLLARAETDPSWLAELTRRVRARRDRFAPTRELAAWRELLRELVRPRSLRRGLVVAP
ncbi:MAG TPA: selenoneine biosynthesis selenosugar synthase SenB [Nannocystaceae bacterium]|nr:selenoneine biosynthesis selenosugar synthase SenB [Nannocystaceae bacterium]